MGKSHAARLHRIASQLPPCTDQHGQPALDLMAIPRPANNNVRTHQPDIFAFKVFYGHAFIDDRGVPSGPSQGLTQSLRGSRGVIDLPVLSKVSLLTEVKSKIFVLQCARGEIQKPHLTLDA